MRKPIPRRRPPRREVWQPADETFIRLLADITLAYDARTRVAAGELEPDRLDDADELLDKSLKHLAAYCAAKAWAKPEPSDEQRESNAAGRRRS
jgi:hypothetical protein